MNLAEIASRRYTTKAFDPERRIAPELMAQLESLLCQAPSSVNSQPWHFVIAGTPQGRERIARATEPDYAYNAPKIRNASHVVVLCVRRQLDPEYLDTLLAQEAADGRFATPEAQATQQKTRDFYVDLHREQLQDERSWMERQVYLALGSLLLGAAALGVDACPMEGFDPVLLDRELDLPAQGLSALVLVALGYRSASDFNARLPKSRLPASRQITRL